MIRQTVIYLFLFSILLEGKEIDFNSQIRPILSEYCFHCHGPDEQDREGRLRLDIETGKEGAYRVRKDRHGIFPGDADKSHVYLRMITDDEDDLMPPPESKKKMKPEEIALIKEWIEQGANYEAHWAFTKAKSSVPPKADLAEWNASFIDQFIYAKLKSKQMTPSPRADERTLVRRLHLDLTGMVPKSQEVDRYIASKDPLKYEKLVDKLLLAPAYAERMAIEWLDLGRYADTNGFSIDDHRDMWAWRDWLISAFLENKSFKDFITEQVAGDLIPNATPEQISATGFLRNSMNTHEGGTIAEEYRVNYTIDKLDAVSTAFMGLTVKCAQCHDHKYDPVSQKDFFRMYAFFNQSQEPGKGAMGNTKPFLHLNTQLTPKDKMVISHQNRIIELLKQKVQFANQKENLGFAIKATLNNIDREISVIQQQIETGKTSVMVMNDSQPRKTFILDRGQYNKPTEEVSSGVLDNLLAFPAKAPKNRLGLAQWITHPDHPLTARVAVNRLWQMIFNRGLVETSEDFGSQGSVPSHQKLLDTLAVQFVDEDWDVRKMLKLIVTSETYKQSSVVREEYHEKDPSNTYMSYAPNYRLKAEFIRDNALAVSGLLNFEVGGPSVYPPQPKGLWSQVSHFGHGANFTAQSYFPSAGKNAYRRSLYSAIKRTAGHPVMAGFDAPNREVCTSRRQTTNTPTQALITLNGPQFVEASKALAGKLLKISKDNKSRIIHGIELVLNRKPNSTELSVLQKAYNEQLAFYKDNPKLIGGTAKAKSKGKKKVNRDDSKAEKAALTALSSILLNLSETVTRK